MSFPLQSTLQHQEENISGAHAVAYMYKSGMHRIVAAHRPAGESTVAEGGAVVLTCSRLLSVRSHASLELELTVVSVRPVKLRSTTVNVVRSSKPTGPMGSKRTSRDESACTEEGGSLVTQALSGGTWFNKQVYWLTFRARSAHPQSHTV